MIEKVNGYIMSEADTNYYKLGLAVTSIYSGMLELGPDDREAIQESLYMYLQYRIIELPMYHVGEEICMEDFAPVPTAMFRQFLVTAGEDEMFVSQAIDQMQAEWRDFIKKYESECAAQE